MLMEGFDEFLPRQMALAMTCAFRLCFVPMFTTPYFTELRLADWQVKIVVSPTSYWEELVDNYEGENLDDGELTHRVHHQIFMRAPSDPHCSRIPLIDESHWYPFFASYLLNILVKCLGHRALAVRKMFVGTFRHKEVVDKLFPYIVQCLPYAHTSQHNLDALRAVRHLSAGILWHPPLGFCALTMQLLKVCSLSSIFVILNRYVIS